MTATIDVNVLVHAANEDSAHYADAVALLDRLVTGPGLLHLFWPVLLGAVRVITHPAIFPHPLPLTAALDNVEALLAMPNVRVHGEPEGAWPAIRAAQLEVSGGNDVPDALIVALMRLHGVQVIYTEDRGFRRFDDIDVRRLSA